MKQLIKLLIPAFCIFFSVISSAAEPAKICLGRFNQECLTAKSSDALAWQMIVDGTSSLYTATRCFGLTSAKTNKICNIEKLAQKEFGPNFAKALKGKFCDTMDKPGVKDRLVKTLHPKIYAKKYSLALLVANKDYLKKYNKFVKKNKADFSFDLTFSNKMFKTSITDLNAAGTAQLNKIPKEITNFLSFYFELPVPVKEKKGILEHLGTVPIKQLTLKLTHATKFDTLKDILLASAKNRQMKVTITSSFFSINKFIDTNILKMINRALSLPGVNKNQITGLQITFSTPNQTKIIKSIINKLPNLRSLFLMEKPSLAEKDGLFNKITSELIAKAESGKLEKLMVSVVNYKTLSEKIIHNKAFIKHVQFGSVIVPTLDSSILKTLPMLFTPAVKKGKKSWPSRRIAIYDNQLNPAEFGDFLSLLIAADKIKGFKRYNKVKVTFFNGLDLGYLQNLDIDTQKLLASTITKNLIQIKNIKANSPQQLKQAVKFINVVGQASTKHSYSNLGLKLTLGHSSSLTLADIQQAMLTIHDKLKYMQLSHHGSGVIVSYHINIDKEYYEKNKAAILHQVLHHSVININKGQSANFVGRVSAREISLLRFEGVTNNSP